MQATADETGSRMPEMTLPGFRLAQRGVCFVFTLGALLEAGCQCSPGSTVADGGTSVDAGASLDAGLADAASVSDAGSTMIDGGKNPDAGNTAPDAGASDASSEGTIVPLYTYPTDATWTTLQQSAMNHPSTRVVAIINPSNGPGTAYDPNYSTGINALEAGGVVVIGYVHTSWGARAATTVEADVQSYKSWYQQLQGIFFDEMASTTGFESYYRGLSSYAKSNTFQFTVGNPGTQPATTYSGTMDTLVIYENNGLPSINSLQAWSAGFPGVAKSNWSVIAYGLPSLDTIWLAQAIPYVGWIYVDTDNTYQSLPPYFDALVGDL